MNCPFSNSSLPQSVRNKELFPFSIQKKNSRHFIFVFPSVSYIAKTLSRTTDSLSLSLITDALSKVRRQLIKFLHMPPRNETLYCFIDLLLLEKIGGPYHPSCIAHFPMGNVVTGASFPKTRGK